MSRTAALMQATARHPVVDPPWRWAALGLVVGVAAALLLFAPASWMALALARATAGQLQLVDTRGTIWTGSGRLMLSGGAGSRDSAVLPGRLDWTFRPGWLAAHLRLRAACCTAEPLQARLGRGWGRTTLQIADGASQWPAVVLAGLGTPWNTVQPEGSLQLMTRGLSVEWVEGRVSLSGQAELAAMAMSSRLSTLRPMGSYRLKLAGGATPTLELATIEGSLQLSGSGSWVSSRLRFQGLASAAPEHEASLSNLLNIIGRRSGARSIISLG